MMKASAESAGSDSLCLLEGILSAGPGDVVGEAVRLLAEASPLPLGGAMLRQPASECNCWTSAEFSWIKR